MPHPRTARQRRLDDNAAFAAGAAVVLALLGAAVLAGAQTLTPVTAWAWGGATLAGLIAWILRRAALSGVRCPDPTPDTQGVSGRVTAAQDTRAPVG